MLCYNKFCISFYYI